MRDRYRCENVKARYMYEALKATLEYQYHEDVEHKYVFHGCPHSTHSDCKCDAAHPVALQMRYRYALVKSHLRVLFVLFISAYRWRSLRVSDD